MSSITLLLCNKKSSLRSTWQMSQAGWLPPSSPVPGDDEPAGVEETSATRWCLPASLLAECTAASQRRHSAASSAQHSTAASACPHASHPIFMSMYGYGRAVSAFDREEKWRMDAGRVRAGREREMVLVASQTLACFGRWRSLSEKISAALHRLHYMPRR